MLLPLSTNCSIKISPFTSSPSTMKHFLLLPPSLSSMLKSKLLAYQTMQNTSAVDFEVHASPDESNVTPVVEWKSFGELSTEELKQVEEGCLSCWVREGDCVFLPRGWWHRVENVNLDGRRDGYTVGVGW
jgi:hypothetical protein